MPVWRFQSGVLTQVIPDHFHGGNFFFDTHFAYGCVGHGSPHFWGLRIIVPHFDVRGNEDGAQGRNRTGTPVKARDFRTTTAFTAAFKGICGLDFLFTIFAFTNLGGCRQVSTRSSFEASLGIAISIT